MKRYFFLLYILLFFALSGLTLAGNPAGSRIFGPQITDSGVVFRYKFPGAQKVAVAGEFSDWAPAIRLDLVNKAGYFEGLLPLQSKNRYRYRLIVDGIWQQDPFNPEWEFNRHGEKVSILKVPQNMLTYPKNPIRIGPNRYRFWFRDNRAEQVSLAGSFNHYNTWEGKMSKDRNGVWTIEVQVFPGIHHFCFVADGVWLTDPNIVTKSFNEFGRYFTKIIINE